MPVATAAFNDSACPNFGMVIFSSADASKAELMPFDSLPIISNPSFNPFRWLTGLPLSAAAYFFTVLFCCSQICKSV